MNAKKTLLIAISILTLIFAAYGLQRGLYVGSEVLFKSGYWRLECRYIYPSGVFTVDTGGWNGTVTLTR